jgi:hypothetical protein
MPKYRLDKLVYPPGDSLRQGMELDLQVLDLELTMFRNPVGHTNFWLKDGNFLIKRSSLQN